MEKREILFKGQPIGKGGVWMVGIGAYKTYTAEHLVLNAKGDNVEVVHLCQYTGLKDAKGVKIFEGDIIRGKGYEYAIRYDEKNACFVADSLKHYLSPYRIYKNWLNAHEMVVIGNVHEKVRTY